MIAEGEVAETRTAPAHVTDADRREARRLRSERSFADPEECVEIAIPLRFVWRALYAFGDRPDGKAGFLAPDGSPNGDLVEAMQAEIVAAALARDRNSRSPETVALEEIREVAKVLAGQLLLPSPERIRLLSGKLRRIEQIAERAAPAVAPGRGPEETAP